MKYDHNESAISRILKNFEATRSIEYAKKSGRPKDRNSYVYQPLIRLSRSKPRLTTTQLKGKRTHLEKVCLTTVKNVLKKYGLVVRFAVKQPRLNPNQQKVAFWSQKECGTIRLHAGPILSSAMSQTLSCIHAEYLISDALKEQRTTSSQTIRNKMSSLAMAQLWYGVVSSIQYCLRVEIIVNSAKYMEFLWDILLLFRFRDIFFFHVFPT